MRRILKTITTAIAAPFMGVYDWLDENIENEITARVLYILWCIAFGWFFTLGSVMTLLLLYVKIAPEISEEEE